MAVVPFRFGITFVFKPVFTRIILFLQFTNGLYHYRKAGLKANRYNS